MTGVIELVFCTCNCELPMPVYDGRGAVCRKDTEILIDDTKSIGKARRGTSLHVHVPSLPLDER